MTTNQLFFALAGLFVASVGYLKYYIDVKVDGRADVTDGKLTGLAGQVDLLVSYMILHEGKISALEERTKKL
jgi:hypothetical protein